MAQIKFVNHASYIISHNNIRLITDPWVEGTAFNEGWALIEPTKLSYSDFDGITHIWFSHEHPDHFSPPNLKQIPLAVRKNITVLFQETKDKKVIRYCTQLGFKECVELPPHWVKLAPDFEILNVPHTDGDSWMCVKAGAHTVLNINDCILEDDKQVTEIKAAINSEKIDVLFTQFSYANWAGNKEDRDTRKKFAAKKIQEIDRQVAIFRPVYTVPFASFVWFCHEENFYMNDEVNKIDFVYRHLLEKQNTTPVVLFPGEEWAAGAPHNAVISVQQWLRSYEQNILFEKTIKPAMIEEARLIEAGNAFVGQLKKNNTKWMYLFFKPSHIFVSDYGCSFKLSLSGFERSDVDEERCDISLGSDSLQYCFKFLWGGSTTRVNGRYQVPQHGKFYNWKLYFQTSELNNHGEKFDFKFILHSVYRNLRRKMYSRG